MFGVGGVLGWPVHNATSVAMLKQNVMSVYTNAHQFTGRTFGICWYVHICTFFFGWGDDMYMNVCFGVWLISRLMNLKYFYYKLQTFFFIQNYLLLSVYTFEKCISVFGENHSAYLLG